MKEELLNGRYEGADGCVSKSRRSDAAVFKYNVENYLPMYAKSQHEEPLQAIDVTYFGPLQRIYILECQKFTRLNPAVSIARTNICELACGAKSSAGHLRSAFRRTGIYQYDKNNIWEENVTFAVAL